MKGFAQRLARFGAALVMVAVLAACTVSITDLPSGLTISNATVDTSFEAEVQGSRQNVICNDRDTTLEYTFRFTGPLQTWKSFLRGVNSGTVVGERSFTLNHPNVSHDTSTNTVRVQYLIQANAAPLSAAPAPQAIVPTPIVDVMGYTRLYLTFNNHARDYNLLSRDIAVLRTCPN